VDYNTLLDIKTSVILQNNVRNGVFVTPDTGKRHVLPGDERGDLVERQMGESLCSRRLAKTRRNVFELRARARMGGSH
jgi:hypothetical protein